MALAARPVGATNAGWEEVLTARLAAVARAARDEDDDDEDDDDDDEDEEGGGGVPALAVPPLPPKDDHGSKSSAARGNMAKIIALVLRSFNTPASELYHAFHNMHEAQLVTALHRSGREADYLLGEDVLLTMQKATELVGEWRMGVPVKGAHKPEAGKQVPPQHNAGAGGGGGSGGGSGVALSQSLGALAVAVGSSSSNRRR